MVVVSCEKPRPAWPDAGAADFVNATLNPGVTQAPQAVAEVAQVMPNQLVFPRSAATEVVANWPVGKPVVGGRASSANGMNQLGFMRMVMGVNTDGDNIVVDTQPAALSDVVSGSGHLTQDPAVATPLSVDSATIARVFPDYPAGSSGGTAMMSHSRGMQPLGTATEALHDNLSLQETFQPDPFTLPVMTLSDSKTYGTGSDKVTVNFTGTASLTSSFSFTPTMVLKFETTRLHLDSFDAEANGALTIQNTLDINVGVTVAPGTDPARLVNLDELLANGPDTGSLPTVQIGKSTVFEGPDILGIPTNFVLSLLLDCGWGVQASMNAEVVGTIDGTANASLTYANKQWGTDSSVDFNNSAQVSITGGGGVRLECGVTGRVTWAFADVGGPYVDVRGGVGGHAAIVSQCDASAPENGKPDLVAQEGVDADFKVQYGGQINALDGALQFNEGPFDIYDQTYPLWSASQSYPKSGLGWCQVQCQDGVKDGMETDVDCGANCEPCRQGKGCKANSDCASAICGADGTCAGSLCTDGRRDGQETAVDCGGGTCPPCEQGQSCKSNADCDAVPCSAAQYGPQVCTANLCLDGVQDGTETGVDCGSSCPTGCPVGDGCLTNSDCASAACDFLSGKCVAGTCADARRDGDETDVDCGGSCPAQCALSQGCSPLRGGRDCQSGFCNVSTAVCVANIHEDGQTNGGETGVDCGGTAPSQCPLGGGCQQQSDCQTGDVCNPLTLVCVLPGCNDNILNGKETSTDCGGGTCGPCGLGKACKLSGDCASGVCSGNGVCVESACFDGAQDNGESDVDCGHVCGLRTCATGKSCAVAADCSSGICVAGVCSSNRCKDGVHDGSETDVDCGGGTCSACGNGQVCAENSDCTSGLCSAGRRCVAGQCSDGVKDGSETGVDCGGSCPTKCPVNQGCVSAADCASGICNLVTGICAASTCFDGIKDGTETDVDCGGACPAKCGYQKDCGAAADCQSGACETTTTPPTCAQDQCSDGIQDGDETGVDCGGSCQTKCGVGLGCRTGADCANPQGLVGVAGYCGSVTFVCDQTSCTDGIRDGSETGVDCGGSCGPCAVGQSCGGPADCASGYCNIDRNVCVTNQCQDGIRETNETDIDCGGYCGPSCGIGKACQVGARDCNESNCYNGFCAAPFPQTCLQAYSNGDTSDGQKLLKPDGYAGLNGYPRHGSDAPIATFCDMTNGGWTPIMYLNSQTFGDVDVADWASTNPETQNTWDMTRTSWERQNHFTCQTDADCSPRAATGEAPSIPPGSVCTYNVCTGTHPFAALASPPATYSTVDFSTSYPESYVMPSWNSPLVNAFSNVKLAVYRNGSLVWTSPEFQVGVNLSPPQQGYYVADVLDQQTGDALLWLRCAGTGYLGGTNSDTEADTTPYADSHSYLSGLAGRCHGWSVFDNYFPSGQLTTSFGEDSILNIFEETTGEVAYVDTSGDYVPSDWFMWGAWARVGVQHGNDSPAFMGICNTDSWCFPSEQNTSSLQYPATGQVWRHEVNNWTSIGANSDELTNSLSGTEISYPDTGLVFVLWAR
jgi:hypothetical protein